MINGKTSAPLKIKAWSRWWWWWWWWWWYRSWTAKYGQ